MVKYAKLSDLSIDMQENLVDYKMKMRYSTLVRRYRYGRLWLGGDSLSESNWTIEQRSKFVASLLSDREENTGQLLFVIEVENECDDDNEQEGGWELIYGVQPFLTFTAFYGKVHESYISKNKEIQNGFSLTGLTGDFKKYNNIRYEDFSEELKNKIVTSHCTVFINSPEDMESRYQRRKKNILQALESHI